jgi:hypothetical protein
MRKHRILYVNGDKAFVIHHDTKLPDKELIYLQLFPYTPTGAWTDMWTCIQCHFAGTYQERPNGLTLKCLSYHAMADGPGIMHKE